jgi:hypothetical protein
MYDSSRLEHMTAAQTLGLQVYLINHGPNLSGLESESRDTAKRQLQLARDFNQNLIQRLS